MGTELQYAINPLCSAPNNDSSCSGSRPDDWDCFHNPKRTVFISFQNSMMDQMVQQQNIESIKNTMLMHETVFRHQVRELHRLYSVQKNLMEELRNEIKQQNGYWVMARPAFDLERPAQEEDLSSSAIEEDQAVAGPSTCRSAMKINSKIVRDGEGEGEGEEEEEEDDDVELTLSLGGSIRKNKLTSRHYHHHQDRGDLKETGSSSLMKSERDQECSGTNSNTTMGSSSTTSFDQQSKRPHWLFRSLNLNRT